MKFSDDDIARIMATGAVGVIPTDTVYGLVCLAQDESAVERLYTLKERLGKPGTLIAADSVQLVGLGFDPVHVRAADTYWPNPVSIVLPAPASLSHLLAGLPDIAVRVTADRAVRSLLAVTGPLLTSSANAPGEPVSVSVREAREYFGDTVDYYIDGGDLTGRPPSTVARLRPEGVVIHRQGAYRFPGDAPA